MTNVVNDYYNALSERGGWLDDKSRQTRYEETFLTFGPLPEIIPGFSWMMIGANPQNYPKEVQLILRTQKEMREVLFSKVNFSECSKVLDFGCGYGSDLIALAKKYDHLRLWGYTIASEQAEVGKKKVEAAQLQDRITILNRNSAVDEFPEVFDLFFGFEVAHHIEDKDALFANIGSHLRDGGYIVMADFISNQEFTIEHEITSSFFITKKEWVQKLSDNQLVVVECVDISQEISNFLHDPDFEENLKKIEKVNQDYNITEAFTSYHQLGKLLRREMASYVLMTVVKQSNLSKSELDELNEQRLAKLLPYAEKSVKQGVYQVEWQPATTTQTNKTESSKQGAWVIFADKKGVGKELANTLKANGDKCFLVSTSQSYQKVSEEQYEINPLEASNFEKLLTEINCTGIIYLWSLDHTEEKISLSGLQNAETQNTVSVLNLVKALGKTNQSDSPSLWLVTQGATSVTDKQPLQLAQTPLWGLGAVIRTEYPELKCVSLDIEASNNVNHSQILAQELGASEPEAQVAWREQVRYLPRLTRRQDFPEVKQSVVVKDGSYLITGEIGQVGIKLADWLVKQGAENLVLTQEGEISAETQSAISQLEKAGAKVTVVKADLADPQQSAKLIETVKASLPPLRGIIYASGISDDGLLKELSTEQFQGVVAPTVEGAWNLHELTTDIPLDFFVCFSSLASLLGTSGQGNYAAASAFLDGLSYYRRSLGLPSLTVNWGPWENVALATNLGNSTPTSTPGIGVMIPHQGLELLEESIQQGLNQVVLAAINWSGYLEQFSSENYPSLLSNFISFKQPQVEEPATEIDYAQLLDKIKASTPEKQLELAGGYFQDKLTKALGLTPATGPSPEDDLTQFAIDSLTVIQLRNSLRSDLKVDLTLKTLMNAMTIRELAQALLEQLALANLILSASPPDELGDDVDVFTI